MKEAPSISKPNPLCSICPLHLSSSSSSLAHLKGVFAQECFQHILHLGVCVASTRLNKHPQKLFLQGLGCHKESTSRERPFNENTLEPGWTLRVSQVEPCLCMSAHDVSCYVYYSSLCTGTGASLWAHLWLLLAKHARERERYIYIYCSVLSVIGMKEAPVLAKRDCDKFCTRRNALKSSCYFLKVIRALFLGEPGLCSMKNFTKALCGSGQIS